MQKTTARVEYRDYVPSGWIAIKFCNVEFYGFRANELQKTWEDIKHKRYVEYTSLYKENEIKIKNLLNEAIDIRKQVKASKPFYRFWHTKSEKNMLSIAKNLSLKAYELEEKNQEIKNKRFFEVHECRRKIEELLRRNCFVLTHTSSEGERCVTKTDIWTLEEEN